MLTRAVAYNDTMSEAPIAVRAVRKRFGTTLALDGMSFCVPAGQVTRFIGPNGGGKSTTIRAILGLDVSDVATALVSRRQDWSPRDP